MENILSKTLMTVATKHGGILGFFQKDIQEPRMVRVEFTDCCNISGKSIPITYFYYFNTESEAQNFLKYPTKKNATGAYHIEKVGKLDA